MNATSTFRSRSYGTLLEHGVIWPLTGVEVTVAALLTGLGLTTFGQGFRNLNFESASLVPIAGSYQGEVQIGPALPGWTVFTQVPFVLYDNMFLDSAGISIFDSGAFPGGFTPFQGRFTVVLEGGFSLSWPLEALSVEIAQTGTIPSWAQTLLFLAEMSPGNTNFVVSFAGQDLRLYALTTYTNEVALYAADVSGHSGQTAELRFTANPNRPPRPAINIIYLDDIRFSATPLAAAPLILMSPLNRTAPVGTTVDLTVYATAYPEPAYQWWFNATTILPGATNSTLELTNLQWSQFGTYTVVVTNVYGSATSAPALLRSDPYILSQPQDQSIDAGQTAVLPVQAWSSWPMDFQWFKEGAAVNDGGNVSGARTASLAISNVLGGDSGHYCVIARSSCGSITSQVARLIVRDPAISVQPIDQTVGTGGTVTFAVGARGSEPLQYQWFFNGNTLLGATRSSLVLTNLQLSASGTYSVLVDSIFGKVTSKPALLTILPGFGYRVLHQFSGPDGRAPGGTLAISDGVLYGTTSGGGASGLGTVFRLNTNGTGFRMLRNCAGPSNDAYPLAGVTVSEGWLYGSTAGDGGAGVGGTLFEMSIDGSRYRVLHTLAVTEGKMPWSTLLLSGTTLYGTARLGGSLDYGSVFKVNNDGSGFAVLKEFAGSDGDSPVSTLLLSGTTLYGATAYGVGSAWPGLVFAMNTDGTAYRPVKVFTGDDGAWPGENLVLAGSVLYGSTRYGGDSGAGTVFKVNSDGTGFARLKSFTTNDAGVDPCGGVVLAGNSLLGTLAQGGESVYGAVYKLNTDGSGYLVLKRFTGGNDGALPYGGLLLSGNSLYGTTQQGGSADCGLIFSISLPIPNVLKEPVSQTVELGSSANFTVRTENDPSLIYQWFFNETNAMGGATTNPVLRLDGVQFSAAGAYSAVVSNEFGMATSALAMLNVIVPVERKMVPALALTGPIGTPISLEDTEVLGSSPAWTSLDSVMLTNAYQWYFDLSDPLPPQRFYRSWQPGPTSMGPVLSLNVVPALTLSGAVGSSIRVDYISRYGPTDAWVALDTVTLTTSPQLYFDTSAIGQPSRLWRLTRVP